MINIGAAGFMNAPSPSMENQSRNSVSLSISDKQTALSMAGYVLVNRDPKKNTGFAGKRMVIDSVDIEDGYCLVGDDDGALIDEAYRHLIAS